VAIAPRNFVLRSAVSHPFIRRWKRFRLEHCLHEGDTMMRDESDIVAGAQNQTPQSRRPRDIVVVGASAGGIEALQKLLRGINPGFKGAVFVVCHIHPSSPGLLDRVVGQGARLPVSFGVDGAPIEPGTVRVAPPDLHLVFRGERIHLARGPKQNRTRPAIDPLFRSAARCFGPRVIGAVLSGLLDDGSAGLLEIKRQGGVAMVQEPSDARFPDMPRNALAATEVDYCVPAAEMGSLIARLSMEGTMLDPGTISSILELETKADAGELIPMERLGKPSPYTCPECSGVLWEVDDRHLLRFRCRVGHVFSSKGLETAQKTLSEDALWAAVRALEERASFSRRLSDRYRSAELRDAAEEYEKRADRDQLHASTISDVLERAASG
jgi:two-component system chemotaxis response regulator CheB